MGELRIVVNGALGKMGQAISAGLAQQPGLVIAAGVDAAASDATMHVPGTRAQVPLATSVAALPASFQVDVLVDFSVAAATMPAVRAAVQRNMHFVVGTTGLEAEWVEEMAALAKRHNVGGAVIPNFALGAVLMMHLAKMAAPHFEYAEIIEMHHETKKDAPSGTAEATARMMAQAKGKPFQRNVPEVERVKGARDAAVEGVAIHSVRLPGAMAHQEVIFGIAGQTLTIRHDTINRDCYVPGIALAVRHVAQHPGELVRSLEKLLGL